MAILFNDGFDVYGGGHGIAFGGWRGAGLSGGNTGRFGGYGLTNTAGANTRVYSPTWTAAAALGVGVAVQIVGGAYASFNLFYLLSGADDITNNRQLFVGLDALGRPWVSNGTTTWTAAAILPLGNWYYFELEVASFHDTTGAFTLKVEGATVISQSGVDTKGHASTATCDRLGLGQGTTGTPAPTFDDLYITNGATLGPARITTIVPSADASVQWTPNSGTDNYSRVSEFPCNGDTSYVSSATVGHTDLFDAGNLGFTPSSVFAVTQRMVARKDDAAAREVTPRLKSGATTSDGANLVLNSAFTTSRRILETDPNTGAAWTPSAVDALQIGHVMAV
jgi:hypothetical protein